ncbi:MAG: SpoIIE family protein phosphatase [Verrucomicrobiota bacterium]
MTEAKLQLSRSAGLRLGLPCDLAQVRGAAVKVSRFLKDQGVGAAAVQACELALVEACNNAVQYASFEGRENPIAVEVTCDASSIQLQIHDHTRGFEWPRSFELPDPAQERGRGLFLIQALMDQARYLRGGGSNCLYLEKQRPPASAVEAKTDPSLQQAMHQLAESEQVIGDMAEELSFCYESLSAIFRCSAELGRSHDLKEFSMRLLTDLAQITSADWFVLRVVARDGSKLTVFAASDGALRLEPLSLSGSSSTSLEVRAVLSRQDVWFGEEAAEANDPLQAFCSASTGLIHPFFLGEQLIGTIAVGKSVGQPHFTAVHANVIHTFADFVGIQIANARFQEDQVHARLVSRELEIAKTIQRSLLPKSLPAVPGYGLAGFCESAEQVGGDFYDVLRVDDSSLLLIVADVMGKGLPAAMFAAILRTLLRAVPEWTNQPGQLLSRVNRLLFRELSAVDMFITAQLVFVDTAERRLLAASAGHCPMLLATESDPNVLTLSPEGVPLGILPEASFGVQEMTLPCNSRLLLYTDGLTEARSPEGEFFGHDRLVDWFRRRAPDSRSAERLKSDLAIELNGFQGAAAIHDDQTFLIMA